MNEHDKPAFNRRRFFGRIGTLLGAAGAVVLARPQHSQAPAADSETPAEPAAKQGYRETEHVRKYYHKARF